MVESTSAPSLTQRMMRAARLETGLYNEVEADLSATTQALTVVVLAAVASGIGAAIGGALGNQGSGGIVGGLIGGVLSELVGWAVWSFVMYVVGTRLFGGTATYGELLRTLGFAYSPGVLLILRFVPVLGGLIALIVGIWRFATGFVAVREALDLDNGKTIATVLVGIVAYVVVALVVAAILGLIGLGTGALTGGLR